MRRRGPGPTSIETAIWKYWAATAGCALAAVWVGMGLQHVLLDAKSCGGRYPDCAGVEAVRTVGMGASMLLFVATLALLVRLRDFWRRSTGFFVRGHEMHRLIPIGAWAIAFFDTVHQINAGHASGGRATFTLAAFGLLFLGLVVELVAGIRHDVFFVRNLVSGFVLFDAPRSAAHAGRPVGEDAEDLARKGLHWNRIMNLSNVTCILGGLLLGYSTHILLIP